MRKQFAKIVDAYQFTNDWLYYIELGHTWRMAWRLARDTVPTGRR